MFGFIDPFYLLFVALPGFLLAGLASAYVKSTFHRYSQVRGQRGLTGAQAARQMLQRQGINNVRIEAARGFLSDHYDPRHRTLRLSESVYGSNSLAAIGVACHEAGHAIQHAQGYAMLRLRSALVPVVSIGSHLSYIIIMLGIFLGGGQQMILLGAMLFSGVVLFSLVTLPVEWNASTRAKRAMLDSGIVSASERDDAASVLNAAFLTYIASAVTAIMTLLYYLMRAGVFRRH